jgi:hypothetical protein
MLIKVRKLGASFGAPQVVEKNGELSMQADMIGELVRVPQVLREPAELMVGELSMSIFPVGIEVAVEGELAHLNGLWVNREILNAVRNQATAAA